MTSLTPQKRAPEDSRGDVTRIEYAECLHELLHSRGVVGWKHVRAHFSNIFGPSYEKRLVTLTRFTNMNSLARSLGYVVDERGVTLPGYRAWASRLLAKNERKMTIHEILRHRHEISMYIALRNDKVSFPLEIISLICSMIPFESLEDDYRIISTTRSETGLEKADGNLYETHQAVHIETGTEVVMEVFHIDEEGAMPKFLQRELKMSQILHKNPNIWQIVDEVYTQDKILIVRHRVECTLSSIITESGALKTERIKSYMQQLLTFINACHQNGIICDGISSGSIYRDEDDVLKITRNPANFYDPPERLIASNEERILQTHQDKKDVWSLGCVFAKLGKGGWLFNFERTDTTDEEVLDKIFKTLGTPSIDLWPEHMFDEFYEGQSMDSLVPNLCKDGIDLLEQMLLYNPAKRISAKDALQHPFITQKRPDKPTKVQRTLFEDITKNNQSLNQP